MASLFSCVSYFFLDCIRGRRRNDVDDGDMSNVGMAVGIIVGGFVGAATPWEFEEGAVPHITLFHMG